MDDEDTAALMEKNEIPKKKRPSKHAQRKSDETPKTIKKSHKKKRRVHRTCTDDEEEPTKQVRGKRRVSKFVDMDASLSGSASEDEDDENEEANEDDLKFLDDSEQVDSDEGTRIKIRKSERKMGKNELR